MKVEDIFGVPTIEREVMYEETGETFSLSQYVQKHPPEEQDSIRLALESHLRQKEKKIEWLSRRLQKSLDLPKILYKYIPSELLRHGNPPRFLRASQPSSLNDVMECGIIARVEQEEDKAEWSEIAVIESQNLPEESSFPEVVERRVSHYRDAKITKAIQRYLDAKVGIVSFSTDPLVPTMWAHYAQNEGVVIGYNTGILDTLGFDLRKVLYLDSPPFYTPEFDKKVRIRFVDEERQMLEKEEGIHLEGVPFMPYVELLEFRADSRELAKLLYVKGKPWSYEKEARLLVDQKETRLLNKKDKSDFPIRVIDIPIEAIEDVYVGPKTLLEDVRRIVATFVESKHEIDVKFTSSHSFQPKVTQILSLRDLSKSKTDDK